MKTTKLLAAMAVFGWLAFAARAQVMMGISGPLNLSLVGQVQEEETIVSTPGGGHTTLVSATTTKFKINTRSLLELIAADQDLILPPKARLWVSGDSVYILREDDSIVIDLGDTPNGLGLLSITYVTNVLAYKTTQNLNRYANTANETLIAVIDYHGSSVSFTLDCYVKNAFRNKADFADAVAVYSFSGEGFGFGTCDDQNMIIKGSLSGKHVLHYQPQGTFPTGNSGEFPGNPPLPPAPGSPAP